MEVKSLTGYRQSTVRSKRNVSFGDDCGYIPNSYTTTNAMSDMKKKGYVIQGINTRDAFVRMYNDVNGELAYRASMPDSMWYKEYLQNGNSYDDSIKYTVQDWKLQRDDFVGMMTRFWQKNKNSKFNNIKEMVTDFLTNSEGLQKPNFFQMFSSKFANYLEKKSVLTDVINFFLKDGRHRLL